MSDGTIDPEYTFGRPLEMYIGDPHAQARLLELRSKLEGRRQDLPAAAEFGVESDS